MTTLSLLVAALLLRPACQSEPAPAVEPSPAAATAGPHAELRPDTPASPDARLHGPFGELLARHVSGGRVDYAGLKRAENRLDAYLAALAAVNPDELDRARSFAFWINAYNAFTLKLILDHHGTIASIKDIPSSRRWDAQRWFVHGRRHSLDEIEHRILRPLGDARIHFAINCASRGCPDLLPQPYLSETLDEQLDAATRGFLADTTKGLRVATEQGFFGGEDHNLHLSKIFDWFEQDFERQGDVVDFVLPFAPKPAQEYIRAHRAELDVEYLDYDWSLNDASSP